MVQVFRTIAGLQTYLRNAGRGKSIGLVPTMGALHAGHGSLLKRAIAETDLVVLSIFVNPLQFGPQEDLERYPRNFDGDRQWAESLGVAAIFAPTVADLGIDTKGGQTSVLPPPAMTEILCGAHRPGHFQGVATIVTKLFTIICPDVAYFGEKDAQQLAIVRRLVRDLNLTVNIRSCPTVREESGLAMSSRNQYLTSQEKEQAAVLYRSLQAAQQQYRHGDRQASSLLTSAEAILATEPAVKVQYLQLVEADILQPITGELPGQSPVLMAIAAYVGQTRLIDNLVLNNRLPIIAIDGPAGAGKSTVTRQVADRLELTYLDTGAMYRALAWLILNQGVDSQDEAAVAELTSPAEIELISRPAPQLTGVKVNGQDVSDAIRTPTVTQLVSTIAAQGAVRAKLLKLQRQYGDRGGIVAEGRDIGTQVFPNAELKIFLTASVQERARRRLKDFEAQGNQTVDLSQLEADIAQRDYLDSTRAIAPLQKAGDAVEIVSDDLTIAEVVEIIIDLYKAI
ncbi:MULTISPECIES: bifunctional pantoate--beta-alanine ligase/(d)CMP kinase [unclassified Synechocystis]|uniref:bifunctional pantoate--beta-alanine ligase/(d)CMP kinase n=1 Tax=unclassified Synechocystis TaxID=2640012 RepID=UPI000425D4E2|nr:MULTISPECIES: bifunctional pantoate--beta-alanine ligase/(d)CMP kinase [unclassified Synechocystis]AIE73631.1 Pantoate--beta-alanine ligase / Cytidylate kinase [Synechocystis sp. PCC 6714]MCT0254991.1 bifunctional pantoate--beta-alanine ligase/(d)CMP kinase [Synechocystis sp. CS-94]